LVERVRALPAEWGADGVAVACAVALAEFGIDLADYLPDAAAAVTVRVPAQAESPDDWHAGSEAHYLAVQAAYDVARELERAGHSAVLCSDLPEERMQEFHHMGRVGASMTVITSAPLPSIRADRRVRAEGTAAAASAEDIKRAASSFLPGVLVGVAPAATLSATADELQPVFDGETYFEVRHLAPRFQPAEPEVQEAHRRVQSPEDLIEGAQSVIVLGLPLPSATVERAGRPPAEAVGPHSFAQYESIRLLRLAAWRLCRDLAGAGHRATWSFDLLGTGAPVATPRGHQPDAFCNRFAAVAAGLARLGRGGFPVTPQHGPNVRYVAVVTDAQLDTDTPLAESPAEAACRGCTRCVAACRTEAFDEEPVAVSVGPVTEQFRPIRRARCDWAKLHSLVAEEGNQYLGWDLDVPAPEEVTAENLAEAIRRQPAIPRYRPCNFELCLLACPLAREQ
jgi:ferredoxin